jgi:hypothetical protein
LSASFKEKAMTQDETTNRSANEEAHSPALGADTIRAIERQRLRAFLEANMEVAQQLHADDFQLINPGGGALSKAVIRYQSRLAISIGGAEAQMRRYWHTDTYEKQTGRWQVVWSQATQIQ